MSRLCYSRDNLLQVRSTCTQPITSQLRNKLDVIGLPTKDSCVSITKLRKRGKKGGIRRRCQRRGLILFGNVQSVNNKVDELCARSKYLTDYRDSCVLCFT